MKLTKSKQFLADAIHASGKGWPDGASWAAQDKDGEVYYFSSKPTIGKGREVWNHQGCIGEGEFIAAKIPNWHQTCLSRDEYFSAYPAEPVADADGWIEWKGGDCPVEIGSIVDVKQRDGDFGTHLHAGKKTYEPESEGGATAEDWSHDGSGSDIIAYRLHRPERSEAERCIQEALIPESAAKPTIEQLAADYRNAKDYAERKQQEADAANEDAETKLALLVEAGKAHGLDVSPITEKQGPELVIKDWRDLQVGDEVSLLNQRGENPEVGEIGIISKRLKGSEFFVNFPSRSGYLVGHADIKFIRRP